MIFKHRYIARITVEAETPISIGSDSLFFDQDNPVARDFNQLPFIPGTAISGFLRASLEMSFFGDKKTDNSDQPTGSNIIISDGYLVNSEGKVLQAPTPISEIETDVVLKNYTYLPIRQHTKINHLGSADEGSKFDNEFVYKGSRFKFEIQLETKENNDAYWDTLLKNLQQNSLYIGGGIYNNFGELKLVILEQKAFDLEKDLETYLNISVDLNDELTTPENLKDATTTGTNFTKETINLSGHKSFFHFGSGLPDSDTDDTNYKEFVLDWSNNQKPQFIEKFVIPGTSIKGALAHRTAYHYNKNNNNSVDAIIANISTHSAKNLDLYTNFIAKEIPTEINALEATLKEAEKLLVTLEETELNTDNLFTPYIGNNNDAVKTLFGTEKNSKENIAGTKGNIIIKDIYLDAHTPEIKFMHNKIDRFTQGTIESALFSEKALIINEVELTFKTNTAFNKEENENVIEAFNNALADLKQGRLPLGGKTSKGHGVFTAKENRNGN